MNNKKNRMLEYLRLFRFQTGAATASAPLIGGLVIGQRDIFVLFILLIIGILYHIYVFVLNEYIDVEVDRKSLDLQKKPLVSGSIPRKYAQFIIFISCVCACALTIIFFPYPIPILFLILAIMLGGIYDIFGKKILGSDFILGSGFFFICLFGASTFSNDFTSITYIVCSIYFFHIIFNNAVEGGLKDVYHDHLAGAKTSAIRMGVKVIDGTPTVTKTFMAFSYGIRLIFIGLIFLLIFQQDPNLWFDRYILEISIVVFLTIILFVTLYKFLHFSTFDRSRLKKLFSTHEITSYFMLLIALSPIFGLWIIVFLFLLVSIWYLVFNIILYGTLLQPLV
ncbi:MAG: UbiA family prenyltransferase [Thermoplasmatales archaeon]|nr:MAG: UbiA family prenyltransferase [Thermoplasmatales archaeon]